MRGLPSMINSSKITRNVQTEFGSYTHTDSAMNGDVYDMKNLSSDKFPLLTTRKKRKVAKKGLYGTILAISETNPDCFIYRYYSKIELDDVEPGPQETSLIDSDYTNGDIVLQDGDNSYLVCKAGSDNSDAPRQIYRLGDFMLIMPDKKLYHRRYSGIIDIPICIDNIDSVEFKGKWYNEGERTIIVDEFTLYYEASNGVFGDLSMSLYPGKSVCFTGSANTDMNDWWFKINAVSGKTIYAGPQGTSDRPIFGITENTEVTEQDGYICFTDYPIKDEDEKGFISLKWFKDAGENEIPDLEYACECNNRLWGCSGKTIYASALGSLVIWEKYAGLSTDSFTVDSGEISDFTGCVNYRDSVIFFTEEKMFRVYGDKPSNFQILCVANVGLEKGSDKSLAIVGETLFFKSGDGIYAYKGGTPMCVSAVFGNERYTDAVGGSDGTKYYVSMKDISGAYNLFVYDTRYGVWHKEDDLSLQCVAKIDGILYMSSEDILYCIDNGSSETNGLSDENGVLPWFCEFADIYEYSSSRSVPSKKGIVRFYIRAELEYGADMKAEIQYDSEDTWQEVGRVSVTKKRTCILPIIPRRADHIRLRLSGTGKCTIFSITREYYVGSFI